MNDSNALNIDAIIPNGDCALLIIFVASDNRLRWIHALAAALCEQPLKSQINVIPATESLVLQFSEPVNHEIDWWQVIQDRINALGANKDCPKKHLIPVCYDHRLADDLAAVCSHLKFSLTELIAIHTKPFYEVAMLGFLPGFVYLTGNKNVMNLPRKTTPAVSVPAGSVAVANAQTGIYSLSSPGGWHVIGRTPSELLSWHSQTAPMLLSPMDLVQFKAISYDEYLSMQHHIQ